MLKKIIFFLLFSLLSSNAFADPVITDTTQMPQNNQQEVYPDINNMYQFDDCGSKQSTNDKLTQVFNANGCCKICYKGKACGNSCISRNYTCHQPPGCACDG